MFRRKKIAELKKKMLDMEHSNKALIDLLKVEHEAAIDRLKVDYEARIEFCKASLQSRHYCEMEALQEKLQLQEQGTEKRLCELIAHRQELGIAKYGQTVAENPLELSKWLQHALEETCDLAVYLLRAKEKLESSRLGVIDFDAGKS